MSILLNEHPASGGPGIEPRWARSDKDAVGTAYSASSRVWFTLSRGVLNEVYFPTIDRPQIRDLQYLVTDGVSFFHDERRYMECSYEYLAPQALGFRIISSDPQGRYRIIKEVIANPHQDCVLIHTRLEGQAELLAKLQLYVLLAPHLEVGGWGNSGNVARTPWGDVLTAHKGQTWLALAATIPFLRCSCGYVGTTDGWQDLSENFQMDWQFDSAANGNIALTGEIDLRRGHEFVLGLAFGESLHKTMVTLGQTLGVPFEQHRERFIEQWHRAGEHMLPGKDQTAGDGGHLYHVSHSLILAPS